MDNTKITGKKARTLQVRLSVGEGGMLDQLLSRFDTRASEYVRSLIREKHSRVFPAYTQKGKEAALEVEPELTKAQICEMVGGTIKTVEGIEMCVRQLSKSTQSNVPLSLIGTGFYTLEKLKRK